MYLLTHHGTYVGMDERSKLTQLNFSEANLPRLVYIEEGPDGYLVYNNALSGFEINKTAKNGIAITRNNKYLSAQKDLTTLVADRDFLNLWETFSLVPDDRIGYLSSIKFGPAEQMKRFSEVVKKLQSTGQPVRLYVGAGSVPRSAFLNLDRENLVPSFFVSNPDVYFLFPFADGP